MPEAQPLVSILVPTYNRELFIEACIRSALAQTYTNIEVVVVDNCSTDQTLAICQRLAQEDYRVKVFQNAENIGPVRNWARCAELATGEYAKVLFSDDVLLPQCVEQLVKAIQQPGVGLAYCAALIGPSIEEALPYYCSPGRSLFSAQHYIDRMLVARAPFSPCAAILRLSDFQKNLHTDFPTRVKHPFDRHGAGPDCLVQMLTAVSYPKVAHVENPGVFFRSHAGSFTAENRNNQVQAGYIASIAWFLKQHSMRARHLGFLMLTWVESLRSSGGRSVLKHFQILEGSGSLLEPVLAVVFACPIVLRRLQRNAELKRNHRNAQQLKVDLK